MSQITIRMLENWNASHVDGIARWWRDTAVNIDSLETEYTTATYVRDGWLGHAGRAATEKIEKLAFSLGRTVTIAQGLSNEFHSLAAAITVATKRINDSRNIVEHELLLPLELGDRDYEPLPPYETLAGSAEALFVDYSDAPLNDSLAGPSSKTLRGISQRDLNGMAIFLADLFGSQVPLLGKWWPSNILSEYDAILTKFDRARAEIGNALTDLAWVDLKVSVAMTNAVRELAGIVNNPTSHSMGANVFAVGRPPWDFEAVQDTNYQLASMIDFVPREFSWAWAGGVAAGFAVLRPLRHSKSVIRNLARWGPIDRVKDGLLGVGVAHEWVARKVFRKSTVNVQWPISWGNKLDNLQNKPWIKGPSQWAVKDPPKRFGAAYVGGAVGEGFVGGLFYTGRAATSASPGEWGPDVPSQPLPSQIPVSPSPQPSQSPSDNEPFVDEDGFDWGGR